MTTETKTNLEAAIQRIRDFCARPGWSRYRMAQETGLSPNTLRGLDEADWNPTADTIRRIEGVMDAHDAESGQPTT